MLDAPVAGGVEGARAATLSVMVGGDRETFDRVEPLLKAIGPKVFYCGPSGNGAIAKLCNNLCSQAQIAAAGEVLSLGVKAGVDLQSRRFALRFRSSWGGGSSRPVCPLWNF